MIRIALAAVALTVSAPALACGDGSNCSKSHCKMASTAEVDTDMAAVDAAEGTKVALTITGMRCGSCADKLTATLSGLEGVNAAAVSHAEGQAKIAYDAAKIDVEKLIATITEAGFTAERAQG